MIKSLLSIPKQITESLSDLFAIKLEDFDGETKYHPQPAASNKLFYRFFGIKNVIQDRRGFRAGQVRVNLLYYITTPMLVVFGLVLFAVASNVSLLITYYNTNVFLNSLIISLLIFGVLRTFYNAFLLHKSAKFVRQMELILMQDKVSEEDVESLHTALDKQEMLLNTLPMYEAIENIRKYGHPKFNDHMARLIKSKLGFRVSKNKANVGFISGLLVMLGLLGTFLGLLATIDAVGEAMNSMSNIGGESGEVGVEEMTGFIGSLAAPLQGMGLAFSTSLFGLSGSLMIGFFLHLAGTPQNAFMESMSRWIDDRVGTFDPDLTKEKKVKVPAKDSDLKDWLTGFVHLSVRTNQHIADLSNSMDNFTRENARIALRLQDMTTHQESLLKSSSSMDSSLQNISSYQETIKNSTANMNAHLQHINSQTQSISKGLSSNMPDLSKTLDRVRNDFSSLSTNVADGNVIIQKYIEQNKEHAKADLELSSHIKALLTSLGKIQKQSHDFQAENAADVRKQMQTTLRNFEILNDTLNQIRELLAQSNGEDSIKGIETAIVKFNESQASMTYEIERLLKRLNSDPNIKQSEALVLQLNDLLQHMNKKAKDLFNK